MRGFRSVGRRGGSGVAVLSPPAAPAGPVYTKSFSGGISDWTEAAYPASGGYEYSATPVVTGVFSGAVRIVAASDKDYPSILKLIPGLTKGQQYTATIAFQSRSGAAVAAHALTDPDRLVSLGGSALSDLNFIDEPSLTSGNLTLVFTAAVNNYIRIRVTAEGGASESVDIASISISSSNVGGNLSSGFWRTDQRIVLQEYISDFTGRTFPNNPRGLLPTAVSDAFNATSLRSAFMSRAANIGRAIQATGAQGVIIWDLVGQEFGHATTYLGAPDEIATWAPELEAVVGGKKIIDEFIEVIKSYGVWVGTTLRPQHLEHFTNTASLPALPNTSYPSLYPVVDLSATSPNRIKVAYDVNGDGTGWAWLPWETDHPGSGPGQADIITSGDLTAATTRVINRMQYCIDRWGMQGFYVDSTVWQSGDALGPSFTGAVRTGQPSVLFMPENEAGADGFGWPNDFDECVPYGELDGGTVAVRYDSKNPHAMVMVSMADAPLGYYTYNFDIMSEQYVARRLLLMCAWFDTKQQDRIYEIQHAFIPPVAVTWSSNSNDKDASVTLSGGNLIAAGTVTGARNVRATRGRGTGKYHIEFVYQSATSWQNAGAGFATWDESLTALLASVDTSNQRSICIRNDPATGHAALFRSSYNQVDLGTAIVNGDRVAVEIDLDNSLAWCALNSGNWNNNPSANPATGVGGNDISPFLGNGAAFPTTTLGAFGDAVVIKPRTADFTRTVSSGFLPWDAT